MTRFTFWWMPFALIACRAPPEAPAELEQLTSWLYARIDSGTDEELEIGTANLTSWLEQRMAEASEGYTVDNLPEKIAHEADGRSGPLNGLVGASVATRIAAPVEAVLTAQLLDDQTTVYPDTYLFFDRTFEGNPRCFVRGECPREHAATQSTNNYPLGLELSVDFRTQWRWVDTPDGPGVVYRTWLAESADVNRDWLAVEYQYFLGATLPHGGVTRRLQTTWIAAALGDTPVPEDMALNMVIDGMIAGDADLEEWINGD